MSPTSPTWSATVLSLAIPPGERRTPIAMVKLRFGPLVLSLGVSRLKKTGLLVRLPMGETGPAIEAEPDAWAAIQHAAISAVAADPVAREHILGPEIRVIERSQAQAPAKAKQTAPAA